MQYPPPFYYGAAPNMYYPPAAPLYSIWSYNYPHWAQQSYTPTAAAVQYSSHTSTSGDTTVNKNDKLYDTSREELCKVSESVDGLHKIENDSHINAISSDTSPSSETNEPQLSLSTLKRNYSSSSSDATTSSNSCTHHHDNNSPASSPQQPVDVSVFEQQVMKFTSKRVKMIKNIKAKPLNLPSDSNSTGKCCDMLRLVNNYIVQTTLRAWNH